MDCKLSTNLIRPLEVLPVIGEDLIVNVVSGNVTVEKESFWLNLERGHLEIGN